MSSTAYVLVCNLKNGGCGFVGYDYDWDTDEAGTTGVPLCPTCHKINTGMALEGYELDTDLIDHLPEAEQREWLDRAWDLNDDRESESYRERVLQEELDFEEWEINSWRNLDDEMFRYPKITLSRRERRRRRMRYHLERRKYNLASTPKI